MSEQLQTGRFYGEILERSTWAGIFLTELRHSRRRRLSRHAHESAYFCLLLRGSYTEQVGRQTITYSPFTVGFHPPGLSHLDEIGPNGGHFFCVEVEDQWLERLREYAPCPSYAPHLGGEDMVWLATRLYQEYKRSGVGSPLSVEGLVLEMLAEAAEARPVEEKGQPRWLAQAKELIEGEFSQPLTLTDVAAEVGVHPVHLSRVFRRRFGQALGDYLNRVRVRFASQQLLRAETRLAELALAAGFADQSHFTRVFKKLTGKTPGAFRARLPARS